MWRGYDILQVNPSAVKVKFRFFSVHCAYLYVYLSALRLGKVHFMALLGTEALTIYNLNLAKWRELHFYLDAQNQLYFHMHYGLVNKYVFVETKRNFVNRLH